LDEKTAAFQRDQFEHGNEDWLMLWDRIGTDEFEIKPRIEAVKNLLVSHWKPNWYSRVFIQQIEFPPFLAIFSEAGLTSIPNDFAMPIPNYPPDFVFSISSEE
jgi:hypothetical protein